MSHIKVDQITSRSGTNVNLGTSGQTITIPSGVTLTNNGSASGFGQTWDSQVKSSNFTAVSNVGYFVDTSGGTLTLTLPASPSLGDAVSFVDYAGTFDTAGMAIDPNGNKINGGTDGTGVVTEYQAGTFTYSDATKGWVVTSTGTPGFFSSATITFDTASGNIGTILDSQRDNAYTLSPVTASASFGGVTYSIQSGSLPSGMTLNSSTGALSGNVAQQTGSSPVNYDFTVRATSTIDAGTFADRAFQITVDPPPGFVAGSGGTEITCGDYKTHVFTGPGTFTVTDAGNAAGSNTLEYLVVAGGGGGGGRHGAGAGAGGWRSYSSIASAHPLNAPAGITATVTSYPISVGGGGGGGPVTGSTGSGSSGLGISSAGGGYGGGGDSNGGGPGGSGGAGTTRFPSPSGSGNQPPVSPPQGNPGSPGARGGGGATNNAGHQGGQGAYVAHSYFGASGPSYGQTSGCNSYFSGGGGGSEPGQPGGLGGGGYGTYGGNGQPGTTNTGGGGGGGGYTGYNRPGGSGGSGIVVIRYKFQ